MNVSDGNIYIYIRKASLVLAIDGKTIPFNLTVTEETAKNSSHTNETAE